MANSNDDLETRLHSIEQQIQKVASLVKEGRVTIEVLVAIHAARELLASLGSAMIGDDIALQLAASAATEDKAQRGQRLEAILDLLPYVRL